MYFNDKVFVRHSEVSDSRGEPAIGIGNGMARTTDPYSQAKLSRKVSKKRYSNDSGKSKSSSGARTWPVDRAILDLGCGDGIMLKAFSVLGWKTIIGIEGDPDLVRLSRLNSAKKNSFFPGQRVFLYNKYFIDIKEILSDLENQGIFVDYVYAFNPCSEKELLLVASHIRDKLPTQETLIVHLRNPVSATAFLSSNLFNAKLLEEANNTKVFALEARLK